MTTEPFLLFVRQLVVRSRPSRANEEDIPLTERDMRLLGQLEQMRKWDDLICEWTVGKSLSLCVRVPIQQNAARDDGFGGEI